LKARRQKLKAEVRRQKSKEEGRMKKAELLVFGSVDDGHEDRNQFVTLLQER